MDVSIIMMLYNQEDLVTRALESILSQITSYSFEIIIGDDASTDNTRIIVESYQSRYPSLIHLNEPHPNYGIIRNYQECLSRCTGDYLMGCSGDDWWHNPNKIQIQVDYMKKHQDCVLYYGGFREYYPSTGKFSNHNPIKIHGPLFESVLRCNPVCALTACVRMAAMKQIGFDDFISQGFLVEDWPKWLGLSLLGEFGCTDEQLATYSIYNGSAHNARSYDVRLRYIDNFHKMRMYFASKVGREDELSPMLEDIYMFQKGETAIKYGFRKDALQAFSLIHNRNLKIRLMLFICRIPLLFHALNYKYNRHL